MPKMGRNLWASVLPVKKKQLSCLSKIYVYEDGSKQSRNEDETRAQRVKELEKCFPNMASKELVQTGPWQTRFMNPGITSVSFDPMGTHCRALHHLEYRKPESVGIVRWF